MAKPRKSKPPAKPQAPAKKPPTKPNGKSDPPKTRNQSMNDRLRNARKLGQRTETITELLSPSQVESERAKVCDAHRELDRVEGDLKTLSAGHKARIKEIKATIATAVATANSAKRDVDVIVEEWVTSGNEVIRIRKDTGELLGNRIARVEDLQEELFEEDDDADADNEDADKTDQDTAGRHDDEETGEREPAPPALKVVDEDQDEFGESEA